MQPDRNEDDLRSDPRSHVFLTAVLRTGAGQGPVRIRNLSAHGALLEGTGLPIEGSPVEVRRGSLRAVGSIAWSSEQHCGVRFSGSVDVGAWIDRAGPIAQQKIDAAIADFRSPSRRPLSFAVLPGDLVRADLNSLSAEIIATCERMAGMDGMTVEIAEQILKIEAAARAIDVAASPAL